MGSTFLPIKRIDGSGRSCLKLEGTLLIYNHKDWCFDSTLLIPVESVQISEHSRFYRDMAILAVVLPLIMIIITVLLSVYALYEGGIDKESLIILIATSVLVTLLLELGLLFALLTNFLFTKKSVCLTAGRGDIHIEFWKTRKISKQIEDFERRIEEKQAQVQESFVCPSKEVFEICHVNRIRRLFLISCAFCAPAVLFNKPVLLVLGLLPIGWYFWKATWLMSRPKEFRKAVARFRRKDWEGAINHLKSLLEHLPEYVPAMLFLVETYVRAEMFDDALVAADQIPKEYLNDNNAIHLEIWKWKRIHMRRRGLTEEESA